VDFRLPEGTYKFRADYLSGQFWSDVFVWQDVDVDIDHGIVDLHVTFNGEDVVDAPVYLFTASGSYLGRYEYTDTYGHASFLVPAQSYKFLVDYEGTQYWSDVVNVIAHEETDVEMPLDQFALNKTNDPNPVRFDSKPPVFEPEGIKVASIGSLAGILSQSIIANTTPPKVYYYLNDHLGTPQLMTDENNVVVWEAKYRPFGEAVVHPYSTVENNVRLPGQYFDQETGIHYNYHRYYDPRTVRYLRPDPLRFSQIQISGHSFINRYLSNLFNFTNEIEIKQIFLRNIFHYFIFNNIETSNLFTYVLNNPINYTDPMGLQGSQWDLIVYLFGIFLIVIGSKYIFVLAAVPKETFEPLLLNWLSFIQIFLMAIIIYFLVKNYSDYLLSPNWNHKLINYLMIGFRWSLPLVILHAIYLSIPSARINLIEDYTKMRIISFENLTMSKLALFSIWVSFGAILEELIFRGIFQQKLQKLINPNLSVFIVSVIFTLFHCFHFNANTNSIVNWFLIGLLSGFAFKKSCSCISSFIPHLVNNTIGIIFVIFAYKSNGM
jgi:RHS repeat-associated protein